MKNCKILIALLFILLITSAYLGYTNCQLNNMFEECTNQNVCNEDNLDGLISSETALLLAENYKMSIVDSKYNLDTENRDSRSVWFSYNELSKYMCALKNEYQKRNGDISKLGIRAYFGRYPKQEELGQINDLRDIYVRNRNYNESRDTDQPIIEYGNKHCLFFVPTNYDDNTKINQDINLKIVIEKDTLSSIWLLNKNHGGLAPPENINGATYLHEY